MTRAWRYSYGNKYRSTANSSRPIRLAASWQRGEFAQTVPRPVYLLALVARHLRRCRRDGSGRSHLRLCLWACAQLPVAFSARSLRGGKGKILKGTKDTALGRLLLSNLLNMNGEHHKLHRHLMQPAFHTRQVGQYHDDMVALTRLLLERWRSLSQIELHAEMKQLTQRIAVKTLFGLDDEKEID